MAKSTRQSVFEGMELLPEALVPFVEKRLQSSLTAPWQDEVTHKISDLRVNREGVIHWDQATLLKAMNVFWMDAFKAVLGRTERSIVNELIEVRNKLSHNENFTYDDAERALDSMRRLMEAISAGGIATELGRMRDVILRTKYAELRRNEERRKTQQQGISVGTVSGLLSWRAVVEPHQDVATGDFSQAEFAADLGKVHSGSAPLEYSDPGEFFGRTYLTDGLSKLLVGAVKRLSDSGGDPVVELQTNFGGGKTHSMLALYHMASDAASQDLPGLDQLLSNKDIAVPNKINRAVLVGTLRAPGDVVSLEGGRKINTLWGEMAWQLGGAAVFDMIADNDKNGIAPGSERLERVFRECSPCLILIDEWIAYLRQIYKTDGLPAGTFDANLTFVQSLTEAVKSSPGTLLVATLPDSQIEVGGEGGQEALVRLKQTFSRITSPWRPASQEESYKIVRHRLFKDIPGDKFQHRDNTVKQFVKLYRDNAGDFPRDCSEADYQRKLEDAYPIHPELFDQLYLSWGSLEKFQRTRGVLRLMAQVIHELWMGNDPSVMIMPGNVEISSPRVQPELMHYLDANWQAIIEGDIDGSSSIPYQIDQGAPSLNRYSATRRVARTIFMGSAPTVEEQNRGLDDKQINLGVVQPGEKPIVFGDALRRLSNQVRFMHSDSNGRYWYSTSPSLNRTAMDRAKQFEEAKVTMEIKKSLGKYINGIGNRGHFDGAQPAPESSAEVPDEAGGVRAVVLGIDHPHSRNGSEATEEAKRILRKRGDVPRVYRNALVFLAADAREIENLKEAMRLYLAWDSIHQQSEQLDLRHSDIVLAGRNRSEAEQTMKTRLRETWCCLIYPAQKSAQDNVEWIASKISTQDSSLLDQASKKLASDNALFLELGPYSLDRHLQNIWNDRPHLPLKELWEHMNRYIYLPRLKDQSVLRSAVQSAISGTVAGPFAYAEFFDEETKKYRGPVIQGGERAPIVIDSDSVIIKPEVAKGISESESDSYTQPQDEEDTDTQDESENEVIVEKKPTRFTGTVILNPQRPAQHVSKIVDNIVNQLTGERGSEVSLKLEVDAEAPKGLDESKVRTLMENAQTLGFLEKKIE